MSVHTVPSLVCGVAFVECGMCYIENVHGVL